MIDCGESKDIRFRFIGFGLGDSVQQLCIRVTVSSPRTESFGQTKNSQVMFLL